MIPRPETELVVDRARERAGGREGLRVLDVGTGSGCIAVTLALELAAADVLGVDVSAAALVVAQANADRLGAAVAFLHGDGLEPVRGRGSFDLVVANPPYVDPLDASLLAPEVRAHEPAVALFAPPGDPDCWVRRLCAEAPPRLGPRGALLVELGAGQSERALPDLAGIPRVLEAVPRDG
jgi:release factor glutamine methyltransferase